MAKTLAFGKNSILTSAQKQLFLFLAGEQLVTKRFYLTGGTALAEFYLKHRYSEDFDLFSEEEVPLFTVQRVIRKAEKLLKLQKIEYRQFMGLHSFFVHFPRGHIVKLDFNYYPYPRIERGLRFGNLAIDSVYDIAVNKVHTIAMKPRARDFIDVYCIVRKYGYDFRDLLVQAKAKFDWDIDSLHLGSRFVHAAETKDFPRMIKKISHKEWQQFFVDEARKLKKDIFKN